MPLRKFTFGRKKRNPPIALELPDQGEPYSVIKPNDQVLPSDNGAAVRFELPQPLVAVPANRPAVIPAESHPHESRHQESRRHRRDPSPHPRRRHSQNYDRDRHHSRRRTSSTPPSESHDHPADLRDLPGRRPNGGHQPSHNGGARPNRRDDHRHERGQQVAVRPNRLSQHGYRAPTPPRQWYDGDYSRDQPPQLKIGNINNLPASDISRGIIPEGVQKIIAHCDHCHPLFKYSKCTGRKKAVCIGINYFGQANELKGCINDARAVRDFLTRIWGYRREDVAMLTDDSTNSRGQPTRANILGAMQWLVKDAKSDDALFFHYSGHGGQTEDPTGDELDGFDEVIFPVDFKQNGQLKDDTLNESMVKPLPTGCRLTAVFDSCHSGTVLDLACVYDPDCRLKPFKVAVEKVAAKKTPADVISFSACKDGQKSFDTFKDGSAVGAMSHAFLDSLREHPRQTYRDLMADLRGRLRQKYGQSPQLGSSHHIDMSGRFYL